MWIDITILCIFLLLVILGIAQGFVKSLIRLLGWPVAIVLGYLFCDDIATWVKANTAIYETIYDVIAPKITQATGSALDSFFQQMPDKLANMLKEVTSGANSSLSETATGVILTVLCFLVIVLAVWLVFLIITLLFSKKHQGDNAIGKTDRLMGFLFGVVTGLFAVYLFLAFLLPITNMFKITGVEETLANSYVAGYLYNHNLLFLLADKFLVF